MRSRGYSLIESILASFLLVFAFFLVSSLFQTGLQYSTKVEGRIAAVQLAEKRLAAMRNWARTAKSWSGFPEGADEQYPGYNVSVELADDTLFSPCQRLEAAYDSGNKRAMNTVAKKAIITVAKPGLPDFQLVGILTRSAGELGEIKISPNSATITGPIEGQEFTARAFDSEGDELKDLFFHWEVEPEIGTDNPTTAEIKNKTRDGRTVTVRNRIRRRAGVWVPSNGFCQLVAYVRYDGNEYKQTTGTITMVAP